jgi:hypothetical protein
MEAVEVAAVPIGVVVVFVVIPRDDAVAILVVLLHLDVIRLSLVRPIHDRQLRVATRKRYRCNQQGGDQGERAMWQGRIHDGTC